MGKERQQLMDKKTTKTKRKNKHIREHQVEKKVGTLEGNLR